MYVPRWRKGSKLSACAGELRSSESQIPVPPPLCKHHYHQVYNYIQPTQTHCVTCGTSLKHSNSRVCPKPALIEQYLKENTEFDCQISDQDRVCYRIVSKNSASLIFRHLPHKWTSVSLLFGKGRPNNYKDVLCRPERPVGKSKNFQTTS